MVLSTVVKAFYVIRRMKTKTGLVKEIRLSRDYHAREAAVDFAGIANIGIPEGTDNRAFVKERIGLDTVGF